MVQIFEGPFGKLAFGGEWYAFGRGAEDKTRAREIVKTRRGRWVASLNRGDAEYLGVYPAHKGLSTRTVSGATAFAQLALAKNTPFAVLLLSIPGPGNRAVGVTILNGVPEKDIVGADSEVLNELRLADFTTYPAWYGDLPLARGMPPTATALTVADLATFQGVRLKPSSSVLWRLLGWTVAGGLLLGAFNLFTNYQQDQAKRQLMRTTAQDEARQQKLARAAFEQALAKKISEAGPPAAVAAASIAALVTKEPTLRAGWRLAEVSCDGRGACLYRMDRLWGTNESLVKGTEQAGNAKNLQTELSYALSKASLNGTIAWPESTVRAPFPKSQDFIVSVGSLFQRFLMAGMRASLVAPAPLPVSAAAPGVDPKLFVPLAATAPLTGRWDLTGHAYYFLEAMEQLPRNMSLTSVSFRADPESVLFAATGAYYVEH